LDPTIKEWLKLQFFVIGFVFFMVKMDTVLLKTPIAFGLCQSQQSKYVIPTICSRILGKNVWKNIAVKVIFFPLLVGF
jgi:hypothetical protein